VVDTNLPFDLHDDRPLRYLFLDLNAYFASCEQQARPELRGRPVGVVPVSADSGTIIAASYEAKPFGVKTGTKVREAKELCPGIVLVKARPPFYVHMHKLVLEAVETVLPIDKVCSIDEMQFKLIGKERFPAEATALAKRLKLAIKEMAGDWLTCSIGIAPNAFLAKLGTELQKPDGLVVIAREDLPEKLHALKLTGFTGINRRMAARLNAAGIFDARGLCSANQKALRAAFGSVVGERWWYLLRGYDLASEERSRKSLGHSHVLPPELRTDQGCREVLLRLLQKASARLRAERLCAGSMLLFVKGKKGWKSLVQLEPTADTVAMNDQFLEAWASRDFEGPIAVGVTFFDLSEEQAVTPSLFEKAGDRRLLNTAVDDINRRFGKNTIYLAGMERAKDTAEEKIAFNKTWLFDEGKGDNQYDGD
jgi:DNA polymerase IV